MLYANYYKAFQCLGSECDDPCCAESWAIQIDQKLVQRYRELERENKLPPVASFITESKSKETGEWEARIRLDENHQCPLFNEQKLCTLHSNFGAELLSDTCAIYPRIINKVGKIHEVSLELSCPEAARKMLLNSDPIQMLNAESLDELGDSMLRGRNHVTRIFPSKESEAITGLANDIRAAVIHILQTRSVSIDIRLFMLGLFLRRIDDCIRNGGTEIESIILSYLELLENPDVIQQEYEKLESNIELKMVILNRIINGTLDSVSNRKFLGFFEEFKNGFSIANDGFIDQDELAHHYCQNYHDYLRKFCDDHDYFFENYLVAQVISQIIPFDHEFIFDSYQKLVVDYTAIKLFLVGISGHHKTMNTEIAVNVVQSFCRKSVHDQTYGTSLLTILRENFYHSMAHMALLLKEPENAVMRGGHSSRKIGVGG